MDDDCVPSPDWLESLVRAVDAHHADGAGGTYVETGPMLQDLRVGPFEAHRFRRRQHFWLFWLGAKVQAVGFAWALLSRFRRTR